jgi:hypothetical protein
MAHVVIDTSAWIRFFRSGNPSATSGNSRRFTWHFDLQELHGIRPAGALCPCPFGVAILWMSGSLAAGSILY